MAPNASATASSEPSPPPSDAPGPWFHTTKALPIAGGSVLQSRLKDQTWNDHMPTIKRLYVDEGKTLKEVMDLMELEHNFTASMKTYKQRLKRWGLRKNIKLQENEDGFDYHALRNLMDDNAAHQLPTSAVQLASGQVVHLDRLATHLRRKMWQRKPMPHSIRPPERFYVCEAVLEVTRSYLRGRYQEAFTFAEEIDTFRLQDPPSLKWNLFFYRCRVALENPALFSRALFLMRQAPAELHQLLVSEPPNVLNLLFKFLVYVTRCLQLLTDRVEKAQFSRVVRALIRYAASVMSAAAGDGGAAAAATMTTTASSSRPLATMLRALARVDDDQLHPLALQAWKLSCQTWDDIVCATAAADDRGLGSAAAVSDWFNFLAVAPKSEESALVEGNINAVLQRTQHGFGEFLQQQVGGVWGAIAELDVDITKTRDPAETVVQSTAEVRHVLLPPPDLEAQIKVRVAGEDKLYAWFTWFRTQAVPHIIIYRNLKEAMQIFVDMKSTEDFWVSIGDYERAEATSIWLGQLMGDVSVDQGRFLR